MDKILYVVSYLFAILCLMSCKTPSIIATQSMIEGNMANNRADYPRAILHYERYLKASTHLGLYRDMTEEARVCRNLAHAYSTQGRFNQSLGYLESALLKDSLSSNSLELTDDYRELGELYAYKGDYDRAKSYLTNALQRTSSLRMMHGKNAGRNSIAATTLSLAQVHLSSGNLNDAETFALRALAFSESVSDSHVLETEAKLILGIVAREKNDLNLAIARLDEATALCKKYEMNSARFNQALSEVFWLKGEIENAMRLKLAALEEAKKTSIKPQIILANMRIGDAYQKLGDHKKAEYYYRQGIALEVSGDTSALMPSLKARSGDMQATRDLFSRQSSSMGKALVSLRLGEMYLPKDLDSAHYFFVQAHQLFETINSPEGIANSKVQLAKVYTSMKDFQRAFSALEEARSITYQPDLKWQIFYRKGILDEHLQRVDSARANYQRAINIIDQMRSNLSVEEFKTLFANTKVEVYDHLIQLLLKNRARWTTQKVPVTEEALYLAEQSRSRAFLDMMGNRKIDAKQGSDSLLLNKEQELRVKIHRVGESLTTFTDHAIRRQLTTELHALQDEHQHTLQQLKLNNPAYDEIVSVEPETVAAIQNELDTKTAIVEYWVGENSTVIWTITRKNLQARIVDINKQALLREVQGCRNAISLQSDEMTAKTLSSLYKKLIQPILPDIKGISKLIVVPHASLHFLPFQALQSERSRFLIEDFVISYAPSSSILYSCLKKNSAAGGDVLAMGLGNNGIGDFQGLPGTDLEVAQIAKVYDDKLSNRSGKDFTETFVKQEAGKYGYLHLATHGAMNVHQPLYSYLLMYPSDKDDGRLSVEEIFTMDFNGKLVTLSACETALGELGHGDELVGLSRAFMYAGAPAVVVSLWKVEDSTTAWLMTRFYQYLISGKAASEALTFAQRDLINFNAVDKNLRQRGIDKMDFDPLIVDSIRKRKGNASRNAFYWAPFILIGSNK